MPRPLLSILVPTLACRDEYFERLHQCLSPQMGADVVLLRLRDFGEETTGAKRHRLIWAANTPYIAFVDDDDLVSARYCELIVTALRQKPDVVGFKLLQYDDGNLAAQGVHTVKAVQWHTGGKPDSKPIHYRTPNHLNPIRTEMARNVGYMDRNFGEDADYSQRLMARYPDLREVFIDDDLYFYHRRSKRPGEQRNPKP